MKREKLLVVIDNLGRGGAEMLLMGILPELNNRFDVILVTLSDEFEFDPAQLLYSERYSLGFSGKSSFLTAIFKLKKIIKQARPHLVHAHLYNSSIVARAACPPGIPLVYSLHTMMSKDAFEGSRWYKWLEKMTLKKGQAVIAVSEAVLQDYKKLIPLAGAAFVLKNYVSDSFFFPGIQHPGLKDQVHLNLLAVGNIKPVKNYGYMVKAFEHLLSVPVTLHIFGQGSQEEVAALQQQIDEKKVNIQLKGSTDNIAGLLPSYDLFVMCSSYEGFGIAPIEAMAMGLPLLLSDIPVFREITHNNGLFFDLEEPMALVRIVNDILANKYDLQQMSAKGLQIAQANYRKSIYVKKLFSIYDELLSSAVS
jgi:glycosyltransferase involved in cell wall biosynthesis